MATPTLALIPTGYKAGKLYSVLPESGVGDFTVVRATEATRVNEEGLIETMGANVPRLDYSGGGCPVLLTESQRTNLVNYSEAFDNAYWIKANTIISPNNSISPNGTLNADLISDTNGGSLEYVVASQNFTNQNVDISTSLFLKKGTQRYVALRLFGVANQKYYTIIVDLENGIITKSQFGSATTNTNSVIKNFGNGWYHITLKANNNSTSNSLSMMFSDAFSTIGTYGQINFVGNGNNNFYSWGAQAEEGSYPTSYIPTSGSAVTRNGDQVTGAGDAATFNDSEGVLMAEISALANDLTYRQISLTEAGGGGDVLTLDLSSVSNGVRTYLKVNGTPSILNATLSNETDFNKIAVKYGNTHELWINGFEVSSQSLTLLPITLNRLNFDNGVGGGNFYGNTSQVQYFNTVLTDSELEKLTSWTSFIEMAQAQNYNII